jgi:N-methylhydantoinase B
LTVTRYGLLPDSAGPGRHRGGLGLAREWRVDSPECFFTANMDRFVHPPYGLAGGLPAAVGRLVLTRDGAESDLPPKADNVPLRKGDRVRLETSGGGGFGRPEMRAAASVESDVALGYVTSAQATAAYRGA